MKWNFILPILAGLIVFGLIVYATMHGAEIAVLNPHGPIALQEKWVIIATVLLCGIVVIPIFIMLFAFAWNFRASSSTATKKHSPNWDHDSWWTNELLWWLVPGVIVLILSVLAWQSSHLLDPYRPITSKNAPITVQVVALDWKWLFIYPEQGIATVNILKIPVNTPIHFEITADAPMNSFWIPSLGGQIMAMSGMTNQLNLMATSLGTFKGSSANISGEGFAGMKFDVDSVSRGDFENWVQSVRATTNPLNSQTYDSLAQPSENVAPIYYSSVSPELYTGEVMKYMMVPSSTMATTPTEQAQSSSTMNGMNMQNMPAMNMQGMNMSGMQMTQ